MTITFLAPDGVAVTAQQERQAKAAHHGGGSGRQLGGRSGFRVGTLSTVLTATSTTWTLTPCAAMIDPGATTHQGMYGWASDANVTGTVTAADATNPRKDIVYILVNDSTAGDGSGAVNANLVYVAGTPAPAGENSPAAPAVPPRGFLVGTISVPVAGGGSPTVVLNPARYVAAGGILPVYSEAERDAIPDKFDGLTVVLMYISGRPFETWDGGTWRRQYLANIGQGANVPVHAGAVTTVTTNTSGDFTITLPTPFGTAIKSAIVQDATDPATLGAVLIKVTMGTSDKTKITGRAYNTSGVALNTVTISTVWTADGY